MRISKAIVCALTSCLMVTSTPLTVFASYIDNDYEDTAQEFADFEEFMNGHIAILEEFNTEVYNNGGKYAELAAKESEKADTYRAKMWDAKDKLPTAEKNLKSATSKLQKVEAQITGTKKYKKYIKKYLDNVNKRKAYVNQGAVGFYKYEAKQGKKGAKEALTILNDKKNKLQNGWSKDGRKFNLYAHCKPSKAYKSTSSLNLENMKDAIDMMEYGNKLRKKNNLPENRTNYALMAIGQRMNGYSYWWLCLPSNKRPMGAEKTMWPHSFAYFGQESVSFSGANPFYIWYHEERDLYKQGVRGMDVAHYLQFMNKQNIYVGMGATQGIYNQYYAQKGYKWTSNSMSIATMKKRFYSYYNKVMKNYNKAKQDYKDAKKKYLKKYDSYNTAKANYNKAYKAYNQAVSDEKTYREAYRKADDKVTAYADKLKEALTTKYKDFWGTTKGKQINNELDLCVNAINKALIGSMPYDGHLDEVHEVLDRYYNSMKYIEILQYYVTP